ncbi:hypothetical protein AAC387_Pa04g2102 [Persea americana]
MQNPSPCISLHHCLHAKRRRTHYRRQSSPASPSPRSPPISTQQQPLATHLPTSPSPRRTQNPSPCISLHHRLHHRQSFPASPSPCITTYTQNAEPVRTHLPASPLRSRHSHHLVRTHLHRLPLVLSSSPSQPISLHHRLQVERILRGPISIASHQRSAAAPRISINHPPSAFLSSSSTSSPAPPPAYTPSSFSFCSSSLAHPSTHAAPPTVPFLLFLFFPCTSSLL